jgi:stage II sporulation protein AA (anti-sigma F factor antagonist)
MVASLQMSPLEVIVEEHPGQTRVVLTGELDIASTQQFERELAAAEGQARGVLVVDLRRVEFVDSTGLRALISADERARSAGRRLIVVRGPGAVERLLTITHLDQRLELVDDPDSVSV